MADRLAAANSATYRAMDSAFLGSYTDVMGATASMDQSKLNRRGYTSSLIFSIGRYKNVRVRVTRLGDLAVGLSAAANTGGPPSPISDIRMNSRPAVAPDRIARVLYIPPEFCE